MGKSIQPMSSAARPNVSRRGGLEETSHSTSPSRRYGINKSQQYRRKTSTNPPRRLTFGRAADDIGCIDFPMIPFDFRTTLLRESDCDRRVLLLRCPPGDS
jgi:hypothetical protein